MTSILDITGERRELLESSFWAKVVPETDSENDCWIYIGTINYKGYGSLMVGYPSHSTTAMAHRVAYELVVGRIPEGLEIDHLCRNRACVNPQHLEAVTRKMNQWRGFNFGGINHRKTHCVNGHPLMLDNLRLTEFAKTTYRVCLICDRAQKRKYKEKLKLAKGN